MCLAFGVERLDDVAAKLGDVLEMQPPQGLVEKVRGLKKLKSIADSRPKTVSQRRPPGDRAHRRRRRPRPAADPALLARRPGAVHHAAGGDHEGPADGRRATSACTGCRRSTRARPSCTGRSTRTAARTTSPPDGRLAVAVALGLDPVTAYSASAPLPKHIDEFMLAGFLRGEPVELVKAKTVDLEVPANAEIVLEGYVEKGDVGTRGAVRRPHRLLHGRRAVPGLPRHRDDDAARRDLSVDRRRQAARRRTPGSARRPSGSSCPAIRMTRARDRRLRPAGRRRVPQLRDRLDPQGVPRPRAEGHARDLGPRDAPPVEVGRRRRRARGRARLRGGLLPRRRQRRPEARRRSSPRARSTISTTRRRGSSSAASSASTRRTRARGGHARVAGGDRDERRDQGARRPPLGASTASTVATADARFGTARRMRRGLRQLRTSLTPRGAGD